MKESLSVFIGETVVVDTDSEWIYIGMLKAIAADALHLLEADAHSGRDSTSTKELYVYETRQNGPQVNRHEVFVRLERVVSVSPLVEIRQFL
jgi:hypothetical protein